MFRSLAIVMLSLTACSAADRGLAATEAGNACTTENAGACAGTTRLLVCQSGVWVVATDCKGPDGCRLIDDTYECDLRGNSLGDLCPATSEGKVRCDPDGGIDILRCRQGVLTHEFTCPQATLCAFVEDAGLTCR